MSADSSCFPLDSPAGGVAPGPHGSLTDPLASGGSAAGQEPAPPAAGADPAAAVNPRLFTYVGGRTGGWSVLSSQVIAGDPLPAIERLDIIHGAVAVMPEGGTWILRGVTSNERYVTRAEKTRLAIQAALGRSEATHAAFIPIRKSAAWWALTQDERRAIFEERSQHITIGMKYLPAIARRLHHCRDLGENEPFDFLTLFDYAQADAPAFDDMIAELRATEEWKFIDREYDLRLVRGDL